MKKPTPKTPLMPRAPKLAHKTKPKAKAPEAPQEKLELTAKIELTRDQFNRHGDSALNLFLDRLMAMKDSKEVDAWMITCSLQNGESCINPTSPEALAGFAVARLLKIRRGAA